VDHEIFYLLPHVGGEIRLGFNASFFTFLVACSSPCCSLGEGKQCKLAPQQNRPLDFTSLRPFDFFLTLLGFDRVEERGMRRMWGL